MENLDVQLLTASHRAKPGEIVLEAPGRDAAGAPIDERLDPLDPRLWSCDVEELALDIDGTCAVSFRNRPSLN